VSIEEFSEPEDDATVVVAITVDEVRQARTKEEANEEAEKYDVPLEDTGVKINGVIAEEIAREADVTTLERLRENERATLQWPYSFWHVSRPQYSAQIFGYTPSVDSHKCAINTLRNVSKPFFSNPFMIPLFLSCLSRDIFH
jgi:hypothetical protein